MCVCVGGGGEGQMCVDSASSAVFVIWASVR